LRDELDRLEKCTVDVIEQHIEEVEMAVKDISVVSKPMMEKASKQYEIIKQFLEKQAESDKLNIKLLVSSDSSKSMNKVCDDLISFIKNHRNHSLEKIESKLDEINMVFDERLLRDLQGYATFNAQKTVIVHEVEQDLGLKQIYNEEFSPFQKKLEITPKAEDYLNRRSQSPKS
jgi:ribosomal protein L31E